MSGEWEWEWEPKGPIQWLNNKFLVLSEFGHIFNSSKKQLMEEMTLYLCDQ